MTSVLVPLAEGFEDLEAVTITDLLTRAGVETVTAGLLPGPVRGSRGTSIVPSCQLDEAMDKDFDMIVLPGGQPGATHLEQDKRIISLIQTMYNKGKYVTAICAAPKVLALAGVLNNKQATCYPGTFTEKDFPKIALSNDPVVVSDTVITSRSPGTAMDFTLTLIEVLLGKEERDLVEQGLVRPVHE